MKKLRNIHEPSTGHHIVDLLVKINTKQGESPADLAKKILGNLVDGLIVTLPKEDSGRFLLYQCDKFHLFASTLEHPIGEVSGEWSNNEINSQGGVDLFKWLCFSFHHEPKKNDNENDPKIHRCDDVSLLALHLQYQYR